MPHNFPFYRICRPFIDGRHICNPDAYILDNQYSSDRISLVRSFGILSKDLKELFDYIEPHNRNNATFSHRIYELFLRACTEFEANCTAILKANGYSKSGNWTISDYSKLNSVLKLNEYEVKFNDWQPNSLIIKPFKDWHTTTNTPLLWYQNYNTVKHDRNTNFQLANLDNLMNAMSGVFTILYAQFAEFAFEGLEQLGMYNDDDEGFSSFINQPFRIKKPDQWDDNDKYDFNWIQLRQNPNPLQKYPF